MAPESTSSWLGKFADLAALDEEARRTLAGASQVVTLPPNMTAFSSGQEAENYLLVVDGVVRIQQVTESGREIVLYRVGGGESCILTTACLLAHEHYMAEGITETEVTAVMVPRPVFDELVARSNVFRDFVFGAYASRITDLLLLLEEIVFTRIDIRLAQRLLALAGDGASVGLTHQELAVELGTAREVISRQLKEFERRGWVQLERGRIALIDRLALAGLAQLH